MAEEKLLLLVSCLVVLDWVRCGISTSVPHRQPDLDFTGITSSTTRKFVGFPFDIGHEASRSRMQPKPQCRIMSSESGPLFIHFLLKEMTGA